MKVGVTWNAAELLPKIIRSFSLQHIFLGLTPAFLLSLQSLPFANVSNLADELAYDQDADADGSVGTDIVDFNSSTVEDGLPLLSGCEIFQTYPKNFKLAHVDANSIAGFKM